MFLRIYFLEFLVIFHGFVRSVAAIFKLKNLTNNLFIYYTEVDLLFQLIRILNRLGGRAVIVTVGSGFELVNY